MHDVKTQKYFENLKISLPVNPILNTHSERLSSRISSQINRDFTMPESFLARKFFVPLIILI